MHSGNGTSTMWALGDDDGSLWVWGYNNNGQAGLGNPQQTLQQIQLVVISTLLSIQEMLQDL